MSRTVPWAEEPARSRLAAVEAALPTDPRAALALAAESAREHARAIEEEWLLLAGAYADACIANARALAGALSEAGLPVLGAERGFTASHHVAIDARGFGGGKAAALALARSGLLLSEIGIPRDGAGGLRIGTQSITRQGFVEEDMPAIADAFAGVLLRGLEVREAVAAVRKRHRGLQWCLAPADLP